MTKQIPIEFQEIFDASSVEESLGAGKPTAPAPAALPMDSEMFLYEQPTGAGAVICQRAVDADFISEVTGYTESEAVKAMTPVRSPVTTGHLMSDFVKRSVDVLRKAPERAVRIQEIVDLARNQPVFRPVRDKSELWAQLHQSI